MDLTERRDGSVRHPWEVQRFEAYRRILDDHGALSARRVLDVGAGDGWFADRLVPFLPDDATVTCWDIHYDDNDLEPSGGGVVRTRERPDGSHDLVLVLDVLEHVEHPAAFVRDTLRTVAAPGAAVLVAVPAYQRLFGRHDVALGHHRRYGRRRLLAEVGDWIEVVEHGSLFTSLLAPRAGQVLAERVRGDAGAESGVGAGEHGVGAWAGGRVATAIVRAVLAADARAGRTLARRGVRLPGLSHWAFGVVR